MAETVIPDYVTQVPSFVVPKMPKELSNEPKEAAPPQEAKPTEQAPVTEGAEKEQAEPLTTEKEPEKQPSTRRFERRIDRATRARAEAEARAETLAKELQELKAKQTTPVDPQEPKMEQFTDIEEYKKASVEYAIQKTLKEKQDTEAKQQAETNQKRLLQDWTERSAEFEEEHDDYAETVGELKPTTPWAIAIMESEAGPQIAYYLGKHLKEAQKIIALPPVSQIREIGKLEAKLLQTPAAPKQPSKAPPPITPVTGSAAVQDNEIKPQMSYEEYMRVRAKTFPRGL